MTIFSLLITIAVFGLIVYLITLIPMAQVIRNVIVAIAVLFLVLYVLQAFGIATGFPLLRLK